MNKIECGIVIVGSEGTFTDAFFAEFDEHGYDVAKAVDAEDAFDLLLSAAPQFLVIDEAILAGRLLPFIREVRQQAGSTFVIVYLPRPDEDRDSATKERRLRNLGILQVLKKPVSATELRELMDVALRLHKEKENKITDYKMRVHALEVENQQQTERLRVAETIVEATQRVHKGQESRLNEVVFREARLRVLVEKIPVGVVTVNQHFEISGCNPAVARILQIDPRKCPSGTALRSSELPVNLRIFIVDMIAKAMRNELPQGEARSRIDIKLTDDEIRHVNCSVCQVNGDDGSFAEAIIVIQDYTELYAQLATLRRQAEYDQMTGLLNQSYFEPIVRNEILRSTNEGETIALVHIDVDHFKKINDEHGHPLANELLGMIGEAIRSCIKAQDIGFRTGGDEFAILLTRYEPGCLERIVKRIVASLSRTYAITKPRASGEGKIRIAPTFSVGAAELKGQSFQRLYEDADAATYRAKREGRDRICFA